MIKKTSLSRRRFLQLSSLLAVGRLAPLGRLAMQESKTVDVAVIGGGMSGLVAARDLIRAGYPAVHLLEAKPMLGGRAISVPFGDGQRIEGGGQFVGPTQERILALAADYEVESFRIFNEGSVLFSKDGEVSARPPFNFAAFGEYSAINAELDALAQQVPLAAPWDAPEAAAWDAMSVGDFLRERASFDDTFLFYNITTFATLNATPDEISLLYFLFYIHSAGGLDQLLGIEGAAQERRFVGGPERIMLAMAAEIGPERIWLEAPVMELQQGDEGLTIRSARGSINARYAIIAMMPAALRNISFSPALPEARQGLNAGWPASGDFKINVVYERPFWREAGLNGQMSISDDPAVPFTYDNSLPDSEQGILVTWPNLQADPALADPDTRRSRVLESLALYFGEAALNPIDYVEISWMGDPYTPGCVSPLPPGLLTDYGAALREPVGRIHWAGTESADLWTGYLDGAVRAGERAAQEVAARLGA